jgi:hypothetical protein
MVDLTLDFTSSSISDVLTASVTAIGATIDVTDPGDPIDDLHGSPALPTDIASNRSYATSMVFNPISSIHFGSSTDHLLAEWASLTTTIDSVTDLLAHSCELISPHSGISALGTGQETKAPLMVFDFVGGEGRTALPNGLLADRTFS